jgi:hypothetical protein
MTTRTTIIRVHGEAWRVPGGFGRIYRETASDNPTASEVVCLLGLIGYQATPGQVIGWSLRRRVEAVIYASNVHARASDNPVQRHPPLDWLPDPWKGPRQGEGAFAGPSPTPVPEAA